MKPVYKFLSVSALALTIALPAAAQQVIDTQANAAAMHQNPQAQQAVPQVHTQIHMRHSAQPQIQTQAQAPTIAPAPTNVAPVFQDPQMAVMMEPTEKQIDPLDYKNTENLNRPRGVMVDMATDNQPQFRANAPTSIAPAMAAPQATAIDSRANLAVPTPNNPVGVPENTVTTQPPMQQPSVVTYTPATEQVIQPQIAPTTAAPNTNTVTIQMPPEQVAPLTGTGTPQQVNRSVVIIGNSDTGVDLNAVAQ